jgi:hypothetical protein
VASQCDSTGVLEFAQRCGLDYHGSQAKIVSSYRDESSQMYYGKKGMTLCGAAIYHWDDDRIVVRFVDMIVTSSTQNSTQVQTTLESVIELVGRDFPLVRNVVLSSDNGAAFAAKSNIKYVWSRNSCGWNRNLFVIEWIFPEAQCRRTILDTHFALVGLLIRRYVREMGQVATHADIFAALSHRGGIADTATILLELKSSETQDGEAVDGDTEDMTGIRKIHQYDFHENRQDVLFFNHKGAPLKDVVRYTTVEPARQYAILKTFVSPKKNASIWSRRRGRPHNRRRTQRRPRRRGVLLSPSPSRLIPNLRDGSSDPRPQSAGPTSFWPTYFVTSSRRVQRSPMNFVCS